MRTTPNFSFKTSLLLWTDAIRSSQWPAVVQIEKTTFYRHHPSASVPSLRNPPIFPGLTLSIPSFRSQQEHWAVLGPSNAGKTTLFEILRGQHHAIPPNGRFYPYLSLPYNRLEDLRSRIPSRAIRYVGFNGQGSGLRPSSTRGAYMSARYESRREETDFTVIDYLRGNVELNPAESPGHGGVDEVDLNKVIQDLRLENLQRMPTSNLSNGQIRRARIAKALLNKPELLLLDEPFMGLDPPTLTTLSPLLHGLASASSPRIVLALRPQDPIPEWITHLMYLNPSLRVAYQGPKEDVLAQIRISATSTRSSRASGLTAELGRKLTAQGIEGPDHKVPEQRRSASRGDACDVTEDGGQISSGEHLVEMEDVQVRYSGKLVLGGWVQELSGEPHKGLCWTVRRGQRWGIFGPNGSGKTTIISLICSDHPHAYSLPIKMFGRGRLPQRGQPGISIFDIQERIGQSSPEVHAFFPRNLTIRRTIENAWADTFLGTPKLNQERNAVVDASLRWFEPELNPSCPALIRGSAPSTHAKHPVDWAKDTEFRDLSFSSQRVALFLRAIIKRPDLVVLDEAFSGMDEFVRDKCMLFLNYGQTRFYRYYDSSGEPLPTKEVAFTPSVANKDLPCQGLSNHQALICVSHVKEEVPDSVRDWMCLPEANEGKPARFGRLEGPLSGDAQGWNEIWGMSI